MYCTDAYHPVARRAPVRVRSTAIAV